ncbi:MAG TPA: hypothetical protein VGE98_10820, partial [Thermoanaerobaculia bacterium]
LFLGGGFTFLLLAILAGVLRRERGVLAAAVEDVHPPLADRLNTLVHLERRRADAAIAPYFRRIERQAGQVLAARQAVPPFRSLSVRITWLALLAVVGATIAYYVRTDPFAHARWDDERRVASEGKLPDPGPQPPEASAVETKAKEKDERWGEVRITEPGRDLRVTKVDVVPLRIEAATSQPLRSAAWLTAKGAAHAEPHALPPAADAHYAVYKPMLYVDQFGLADWDVLSYSAKAATREGSYASEIYFLEVRPFREDILKLPGGPGGKAYETLNELSGLIDRQKDALRETHRFLARSYDRPERRREDQKKRGAAEGDLADASRHLYARIAAMENQNVGEVLDHLAQAEGHLHHAADALAQTEPEGARPPEQAALEQLVQTRKMFQKAVAEHPEAFGGASAGAGEPPPPVADLPGKLKKIAEFRDDQKAARGEIDQAVAEQRRIARASRGAGAGQSAELAAREKALRQRVGELHARHPRAFSGAEKEAKGAEKALGAAEQKLAAGGTAGQAAAEAAQGALEALQKATGRGSQGGELLEAYRLKDLLDRETERLGQVEKQPDALSAGDLEALAQAARGTTRELGRLADDAAANDESPFGPALRDALSPEKQAALERDLDRMTRANGSERGAAAGAGKKTLSDVGRAFEKSAPSVVQGLRANDALGAGAEGALDRALRQIASLLPQGTGAGMGHDGKRVRGDEREKQKAEALTNLRLGLDTLYGKDRRAAALLLDAERAMKEGPEAGARMKKLIDEIERFRVEVADAHLAKPDDPKQRHVDSATLPAAYRERIERYFRKLSE